MTFRTLALIVSFMTGIQFVGCSSDSADDSTSTADTTTSANDEEATSSIDAMTETPNAETEIAPAISLVPVELATISRAHRFGDIYLTGQPSQDDFFAVRDAGVKAVINQRHERENTDFNEREVVTGLGMTYHALSFGAPAELTDELLDEHRAMFRDAPKPMLIHCASANRTGATWLVYAVLDRGLSMEDALEEARMVGLRSQSLEDVARDYIERKRAEE